MNGVLIPRQCSIAGMDGSGATAPPGALAVTTPPAETARMNDPEGDPP